ncbi:MAG TPA: cytochrome P450 [Acidobacteriaceae bacterium]|nr:cytochrome P450 [Acidobacteriaceae bacterium]
MTTSTYRGDYIGPQQIGDFRLPAGLRRPLHVYLRRPWVNFGQPIPLFEHLHERFGRIAHYRFLGRLIIFVNDPEWINEILVRQASSFVKESTVRRMKILLGEGLITADDPIHMRQRRIAAPAFHRQRISGYADAMVTAAAAMRDDWRNGQEIDISAAMMRLSLEIIARTLFDTEVTPDVLSVADEVNTIMGLYNFLVAFPKLESLLHWPIPGVVQFRRSRAKLDAIVARMIASRRALSRDALESRGDLLSMLVAAQDEDKTGMTDEQLRDETLTIFLAGYETVANALAWTWYLLSQNPEARERMYREVDEVLGGRTATLADTANLRYTEMCFAESMRLYPPAWAMGRESSQPVQLGEYRIPAGAHFFFSQYVMHRAPEYWDEPLAFRPERHTPEAKAARPRFVYFPFGGGRRQCIGEGFAWMEGVLALATIAQRWRLEFVPRYPVVPQAKITLRPKFPMMMTISNAAVSLDDFSES